MEMLQHPEITCAERTGYPSWQQEDDEDRVYCCECGEDLTDCEDVYECRTHATLCEDCLLMLHKKYV